MIHRKCILKKCEVRLEMSKDMKENNATINFTDYIKNTNCPRGKKASVRFSNNRFNIAKEQYKKVSVDKKIIIERTNEFLEAMGIETCENPCHNQLDFQDVRIDKKFYEDISTKYNLKDMRDLVWMKFTKDGHLGVVAQGADINFQIPDSEESFMVKKSKHKWKYNSSGILVKQLKTNWNTSFVLIFPLTNIPKNYTRQEIECGIGNYIIEKGIPILDFYSHRYIFHKKKCKESVKK